MQFVRPASRPARLRTDVLFAPSCSVEVHYQFVIAKREYVVRLLSREAQDGSRSR